jgi:hypothetical protein
MYRRRTRKRHPEDKPACPIPPEIAYLWEWFWDVSAGRPASNGVMLMIPATEIRAWQELNGIRLKPWEMHTLRALDRLFIEISNAPGE